MGSFKKKNYVAVEKLEGIFNSYYAHALSLKHDCDVIVSLINSAFKSVHSSLAHLSKSNNILSWYILW